MIDLNKSRRIARTGTAVALTLTMTLGSLPLAPVVAYAKGAAAISASVNKDGYALEVGKQYSVPVSLKKADGSSSMAASYFEKTGTVTWDGSSYTLRFTVKESGRSLITNIEGVTDLGSGSYEVSISTLDPVKLAFTLQIPVVGTMSQTGYLHVDASSLPTTPAIDVTALENAIAAAQAVVQGDKTDEAFATLQQAIATAKAALDTAASQDDVDAAAQALSSAVDTFKASADKTPETPDTPEATELGFSLYYKGENATDKYANSFEDKVRAVPQADGTYLVEFTAKGSEMMQLGDITVGGTAVSYTDNADGSRTYKIPMADLKATLDFTFGYTIPSADMTHNWPFQLVLEGGTYTGPSQGGDEDKVDTSKLQDAVKRAEALKEADGSADAWTALQSALASANKVLATSGVPQAGIDAVTAKLEAAITAFEDSGPSTPSKPEEKPSEDATLEVGKTYTVPASLVKADGSASMAAGYFDKTATVVYDGTSYQVTFKVTLAGQEYIKSVRSDAGSVVSLGDGAYRVSVSSLKDWISLTFSLSTPVGSMDQTGYLKLDTSQLGLAEQEKPTVTPGISDGTSNDGTSDGTTTSGGGSQTATEAFQVGHTYRVPVAFKKTGSSETSMASQYFGDTALVRPQADGTFRVSFSTNKSEWISSLTYGGSSVSRSDSQYTLSIPASKTDKTLRLGLHIVPMSMDVSCDMHLYLSRATDLGAGKESLAASSEKVLPQTGDMTATAVALTAGTGAVALAGAVLTRRRKA